MTDSDKNGGGGLPTAAYKVTAEREHLDSDIEVVMKNRPQHNIKENDQVDELVRRKDVKALIQEAVEHELEKARDSLLVVTDKGGGTDRYRERLQEGLTYRIENLDVEELLEELEQ